MTKNVSHISTRVKCPQCNTKTMRLSVFPRVDLEYYCDRCHDYFGIRGLVYSYNYDSADFYGDSGTSQMSPDNWAVFINEYNAKAKRKLEEVRIGKYDELSASYVQDDKIVATTWFDGDSVSVIDEPVFRSLAERDEAYQMVQRMFDDTPEGEINNEVDYGYPI